MKLLHLITTLSRGGAEHHLLSLVKGQIASGTAVDIAYLKGNGNLTDRFRGLGARDVRKFPMESLRQVPRCVASLRAHIRAGSYDCIHTHLLKANVLGGIAARSLWSPPPVVASKHNDEHQLRNPLIGWTHGVLSRCCDDHIITLSDHVGRFVVRHGFVSPKRVTRVYYGLDPEMYPPPEPRDLRAEFGLEADAFVFGIIARITEQKGHLDLLPALARLLQTSPRARLLVVGGPGYSRAYLRRVEAAIEGLALERAVRLVGPRRDAFSLIGGLDCLVMPSLWEGFGMVFLEALFQGVPVVATRAGAIPEVIRDGVDGILAEPASPGSLCDAMERMITEHASFRERLRGRETPAVLERFSADTMVRETDAVYRRVIRPRPPSRRELLRRSRG